MGMGIPARAFYLAMRIAPPGMRSRMWRRLYQRMSKSQLDSNFRFMNYGYKDETQTPLEDGDEGDRLFIQLYHMNIREVRIENKDLLEIGSGRGGGASWIARSLNPRKLVAVDYSGQAVKRCKEWYSHQENLEFIEGNAEALPLEDESFDVVYNVESSHCYANIPKFLGETFRVTKNGGKFCWTDMRDKKTMEKLHDQFIQAGFTVEYRRDVTKNVVDALDLIDEGRREMIRQSAPPSLRKSFETFGGVPGTPIYEALKEGRINYFHYLMTKP